MGPQQRHDDGDRDRGRLTDRLLAEADELAAELAQLIRHEVDSYRETALVSDTELHANLRSNLVSALEAITRPPGDHIDVATGTGRSRARAGVPLPALMEAYRVGSRFIWEKLVAYSQGPDAAAHTDLTAIASDVWSVQDETTQAMATGYQAQQVLMRERERSGLVSALLEGRVVETSALWETAEALRLSLHGNYVVVAAELARRGRQSLGSVEAALHLVDLTSAWYLTPDLQIGLVQVENAKQSGRLLSTLHRLARHRVGVSPEFTDLREGPEALRLARIAMAGSVPARGLVTVFDDAALAVITSAARPVSAHVAGHVLKGLHDIPASHRALLLDTLTAWLDNDGSMTATAATMYCHYNTVRHRLHKLERLTGRSLTVPREQVELCLALEIERQQPAESSQPEG